MHGFHNSVCVFQIAEITRVDCRPAELDVSYHGEAHIVCREKSVCVTFDICVSPANLTLVLPAFPRRYGWFCDPLIQTSASLFPYHKTVLSSRKSCLLSDRFQQSKTQANKR